MSDKEKKVDVLEEESFNMVEALKTIEAERRDKERFIWARMWLSTIVSALHPDRVQIPENIGNRILIGNNQIVTKNSLCSLIMIREFSTETPIGFMSKFIKHVKTNVPGVTIDYVTKNRRYRVNLKDSGLLNRERQWKRTLDNPLTSIRNKKRAARLLYTLDIAKTQEVMFKTRFFIKIRTKDGATMKSALETSKDYLESKGIRSRVIKSKMETFAKFILLISSRIGESIKDIPYSIQSSTTLAELMPATQGHNDTRGLMLGMNMFNRSPYFFDAQSSAAAKNIIIVGPSGKGKTYMMISWALDAHSLGIRVVCYDIKGNEFTSLILAHDGLIIPMGQLSRRFVNTLVLHKEHIENEDALGYFNERFQISVERLRIVAELPHELEGDGVALINEFLMSIYTKLGVVPENYNTWKYTAELHPHQLYSKFVDYLSADVKKKYSKVYETMLSRFKVYYDKRGSKSYIFMEEFEFDDIYKKTAISFDFELLTSSGVKDETIFKLRLLDAKVINSEYSRYQKANQNWVMKFLEEAQYAEDYLMKMYADEFALRRSQNQITVLSTNSIQAVAERPSSKPILESVSVIVIGPVIASTREYLIREYGLEHHRKILEDLSKPGYENVFFLVNRMSGKSTNAPIKVFNPEEVTYSKLYKVVDTQQ